MHFYSCGQIWIQLPNFRMLKLIKKSSYACNLSLVKLKRRLTETVYSTQCWGIQIYSVGEA